MKRNRLILSLIVFLFCGSLRAQLSGVITVPSSPKYPDLKSIIDSLNNQGVTGNGVVINVIAGNPQNAPTGGYRLGSAILNPTVNSDRPITINGNGNIVTSSVGVNTVSDGVFTIVGTDYVTIDSLNIAESLSNTTATTQMEWGYGLVKLNSVLPYDGCQHIVIRKCTISLGVVSTNSTGIYVNNHSINTTTQLSGVGALPTDGHNNNSFYGNTITNSTRGIYINGATVSTGYNINNVIGVPIGNKITLGGNAGTAYGIYLSYDSVAIINNNILMTPTLSLSHKGTAYGIYMANKGGGNVVISDNNISLSDSGTTANLYGIYTATTWVDTNSTISFINNNLSNWNYATATSGAMGGINCYGGADTVNFINNTINNIAFGNGTSSGSLNLLYSSGNQKNINLLRNVIKNVLNKGGTAYGHYGTSTSTSSGLVNVNNNIIKNVTSTSSNFYAIGVSVQNSKITYIARNKIDSFLIQVPQNQNILFSGYVISAPNKSGDISYDTVNNITITGGNGAITKFGPLFLTGVYGMQTGNALTTTLASCHNNFIGNITSPNGQLMGLFGASISGKYYNNTISNLKLIDSGIVYGAYLMANSDTPFVYNNFITDIGVGQNYNTPNNIYGLYISYLGASAPVSVCYNTIKINTISSGANLGAIGVFYDAALSGLDFRNNIININVLPKGMGFTAALCRNSGTAGVIPTNFASTSNGNIYYTPNVANSYLYAEGSSLASLVNNYNLTNDPAFNTPCGLYKAFMGRDQGSFMEDNLGSGSLPGTYIPVGGSLAKGLAAAVTQITTDFAGANRTTPSDAGALQFIGNYADIAPPTISYNPFPVTSYCLKSPTLTTTITDGTSVNTNNGLSPRLYYKKSTDNNTFGNYPTDNNSSFNGWKYVEGVGGAPNFTFNIDYAKLTSLIAVGDSISYFVVAQDNAPSPNVGVNTASFSQNYCPISVNLNATANAVTNINGYTIKPRSFAVLSASQHVCSGGRTMLSIDPIPLGATFQWLQDTGNGVYFDIVGATNATYTTAALLRDNNFKAKIKLCTDSIITASLLVSVAGSPNVITATNGSRCDTGVVALHATAPVNAKLNWYDAQGDFMDTGVVFNTPIIDTTTSYYVAASSGGAIEQIGSPQPSSTTNNIVDASTGLTFTVNRITTINSVKMYVGSTLGSAASIQIVITNLKNNVVVKGPIYNFSISSSLSEQIVPINATLYPGTYKMTMIPTGIDKVPFPSTPPQISFPFNSDGNIKPAISITGGIQSGYSNNSYYYFYAWSIATICEGPLTKVDALIFSSKPQINISANVVCADDSVVLSTNSNSYTYQWQLNGVNINGAINKSYIAKSSGDYNVNVTYIPGCNKSSITKHITVNPLPVASVAPIGSTIFCANDSVILKANSVNRQLYQWKNNGIDIPSANADNYTAYTSGSYTVFVTDTNGCFNISNKVNVTENLLPIPVVNWNGTILSTGTYAHYQWYFNGQVISGADSNAYTPTQNGTYRVTVTDANGCTGVSAEENIFNVSVRSISSYDNSVKIYPNPVTSILYVSSVDKVNIIVSSIDGKQLLKQDDTKSINIHSLVDGIYLISITNDKGETLRIDKVLKTSAERK